MNKRKMGFSVCGSFCTFSRILEQLKTLTQHYDITPILSEAAAETDTRFGGAIDFRTQIETITGNPAVTTLCGAEPIGPGRLFDIMVVAPCTGNTLAKLAHGITDSCVTMACKAHLRNGLPVVLALSTNDGLSGNSANIGLLLARRLYYFVPFRQDDPLGKPYSLVADFARMGDTVEAALDGRQIQPVLGG
ncbi:MAG: dipicolinate synthase subunit B [Oscillospiraceae bacterium]|nr:dipicolinate synthase subunit B [Oscillospiraceae bacterium]